LIQIKLEPLQTLPDRLEHLLGHSGLDMKKNPAIAVAVITTCLLLLWLVVFFGFSD